MTWRKPLVLAAALGLSIAAAHAQPASLDVPVQAGADGPELDACPRLAAVTGLDPKGDDFLSVRSGPGGRPYREVDRIHTGQRLSVCETRGPWFGVVYADREGRDCGVATPWPRRTAYAGPCRSGWVHRRYVTDLAG
ncbi:integron [Methylobacterium sp. WL103]|uniref:integron n=1 Tax=Methylobacterium sp. WL103 TaxID=2603891 RepID=UPI0011CCD58F|nr:integron [Methylobacterium sp. WL103]TXM90670.1 integron [Methylobacterium sp. WL103]